MISLSEKSKETASSLLSLLSSSSEKAASFSDSTPNVEMLSNIYKLMVKKAAFDKTQDELDDNKNDAKHFTANKRHQEILEALSFKPKIKELEPVKVEEPKAKVPKKPKVEKKIKDKKPKKVTRNKKTVTKQKKTKVEKPTEITPQPVSGTPVISPIKTVAVLGAAGFAGAASAISLRGETGRGHEDALKNVGQVVGGDPEPGYYSYGLFGMNSKSKTIDNFVAQNPQFGFKSKPGTSQFNNEWKEISKNRAQEMYQAQMAWYENNVLNPLQKEMQSILPTNVASDQRVVAYMADRRIQYGKVLEASALQYSMSDKPETFINRMTEYDLQNIGKAFSTYLKQHPGSEKGLIKRIENRKKLSLELGTNTIGTTIDKTSKENKQLHQELNETPSGSTIINQTNVSSTQTQQQRPTEVSDDKSAYERKSRIK